MFACLTIQVVTSVLEALKKNDHPYHNHGVEVRYRFRAQHVGWLPCARVAPSFVCEMVFSSINFSMLFPRCRKMFLGMVAGPGLN